MSNTEKLTAEQRAAKRAKYLTGLMWHAGVFLIINVFFWAMDSAGAGGITWAYWITAAWGLALALHVLAYLIDGRDVAGRKSQQYLDAERRQAHSQ